MAVEQAKPNLRTDISRFPEKVLRRIARDLGGLEKEHKARKFSSRFYREIPEVKNLRGCGKGRPCVIVGNGPSLNKLDLSLISNVDTFCVNAFFLKFDEIQWRPTHYVVEDSFVALDRAKWINELRGCNKFFPKGYDQVLTPDEDTRYLNFIIDYSEYENFPEFSTNAARCVWVGGTVTYINLQLAFYMEYNPVVLIGIDHNYVVNQDENIIKGKDMTSLSDDVNHFHPDYFGKGFRWHDPKVWRMELAYQKARKVFEAHGREVLNATAGGKLEVFKRADFEELFRKNK